MSHVYTYLMRSACFELYSQQGMISVSLVDAEMRNGFFAHHVYGHLPPITFITTDWLIYGAT